MSEKVTLTPSAKKYEGPKYDLKEDLKILADRISKLDKTTTATELEKYKNIIPGKDAKVNTFEMMALYQRAMNLYLN